MSLQTFRKEVREAVAGRSLAGLATSAGLPRDAIRSILVGHDPRLSRSIEVARALCLEFYVGPPRGIAELLKERVLASTDQAKGPTELELAIADLIAERYEKILYQATNDLLGRISVVSLADLQSFSGERTPEKPEGGRRR